MQRRGTKLAKNVKDLHYTTKEEEEEEEIYCAYEKQNNTNSDVTTSTKVLCRAARIAETITAGRPN